MLSLKNKRVLFLVETVYVQDINNKCNKMQSIEQKKLSISDNYGDRIKIFCFILQNTTLRFFLVLKLQTFQINVTVC